MEQFQPHLADNPFVVTLILSYALMNVLAWSEGGIFLREIETLKDMHNERTFVIGNTRMGKIRPLLFFQYFLFFGLCLFCAVSSNPTDAFWCRNISPITLFLQLLGCIAIPLGWFALHHFFSHWLCFIFGGNSKLVILDRIHKADYLIAGPAVLMCFFAVAVMEISSLMTAILLSAIFIITQIVFIFSLFKIFFSGFGSLCLFLLYLCTLEIAPLAVLFVKLG